MIETNRKAKTVIEVFDDILKIVKLDKCGIGLVVERITVYEDRLHIKLKSDVDTLLSLTSKDHSVNFNSGNKDISSITIKSKNHLDKVFTVNNINNGDPFRTCSFIRRLLFRGNGFYAEDKIKNMAEPHDSEDDTGNPYAFSRHHKEPEAH